MKTAVAFLIYNRPQKTKKVFEVIRQAKPPMLLVVADGPRPERPNDAKNCAAARAIIEQVDWNCEILKNYSDVNLGCGQRVKSGLDWVFDTVNRAIVLEDDCLPDPSFFRFCDELLEKYQDDERIMTIIGTNGLGKWKSDSQSYHFSSYCPGPWGWASWSRAWCYYDYDINAWDKPEVKEKIRAFIADDSHYEVMASRFGQVHPKKEVDTWDYQWFFTVLSNSGLTIVPSVNLIANIGFGSDATHTKSRRSKSANRRTYSLQFPLKHPNSVVPDREYNREQRKVGWLRKIEDKIKAQLRPYKHKFLNLIKVNQL